MHASALRWQNRRTLHMAGKPSTQGKDCSRPRCATACCALSVCRRRHGTRKWQRVVRTVGVRGRMDKSARPALLYLQGFGDPLSICPAGSGKALELDALFSSASQIHTHTLSHNFSSAALTDMHTCTRSHPFHRVKCLRIHCTHSPLTAFHTQHEQLFRPDGCSPHESPARCYTRHYHCRGVGYAG